MAQDDGAPLLVKDKRQTGFDMGMPQETKSEAAQRRPAPTDTNTDNSADADKDSDAGDSDDDRIIKFSDTNLDNDDTDRVFNAETGKTISFAWEVTEDDVQLNKIELVNVDDPDKPVQVRWAAIQSEGGTSTPGSSSDLESDFFENLNAESGSTMLNLGAFIDDEENLDYDKVYAVRMTWGRENSDVEGESISPYFAVIDGQEMDSATTAARLQMEVLALDNAENGTENDGEGNTRVPDNGNPSSNSPSSSETAAADATNVADSDDDSSGGGGGGGLAPGVIAGIVVGVVVFLALIGGLVFFLLRRRRKTKRQAGYDGADASNAYIVDKVDTTAQSPRSPYSDDGQEQHTPLDPQAHHNNFREPAAGEGSNGSEYAGLYQAGNQERGGVNGDASPRVQSRSNTGNGNYEHLVEEGMTEDDIRRLEDEERQLDAEIERAGRR